MTCIKKEEVVKIFVQTLIPPMFTTV